MTWYLIIFFVASAGSSPGGNVEYIEFSSKEACYIASEIVNSHDSPRWSGVNSVCVKK